MNSRVKVVVVDTGVSAQHPRLKKGINKWD